MFFFRSRHSNTRRAEVRKNRPDTWRALINQLRAEGIFVSVGIALAFAILGSVIFILKESVVPYRPGDYIPQDIRSRIEFVFIDKDLLYKARNDAREATSRVYAHNGDPWKDLEAALLAVPDRVAGKKPSELDSDPDLRSLKEDMTLTSGSLSLLQGMSEPPLRDSFRTAVHQYVESLRPLVIVPTAQFEEEMAAPRRQHVAVELPGAMETAEKIIKPKQEIYPADVGDMTTKPAHGRDPFERLVGRMRDSARRLFLNSLDLNIVNLTIKTLKPTHVLDAQATTEAQNKAAEEVPRKVVEARYSPNQIMVEGRMRLNEKLWALLKAEKSAYLQSLGRKVLESRLGSMACMFLMTLVLSAYIAFYQPRIVRKHARATALAALLLAMLLLAELAAIGTGPLYIFGTAPTILVAMILAIAYDRRFAMGVASIHGILVTAALEQGIGFFAILWVGVLTCCFMLDEIRTRSKLVEVGGVTALAMTLACLASGAMALQPIDSITRSCLYTGAAGLAVGFVVLGILPFIEKTFRITTNMTLLELADSGQPLMRRLALEAPGTYNHSMQVATLAEAAAEAINANSLLCRVGAYYHDIGKINKAEYFIENQTGGPNRHFNLSPNVSLLIIIGHVKFGLAMAREYNLPLVLFPFIQQHHGTTLVEYFYNRARNEQEQKEPEGPTISDTQYRYPGPKPCRKEVAIVMLADAVESAARAMSEPNTSRIETLVHELSLKRLLDGQFDECDLTMRELELVERSLIKTLLGVYHGRIAYPVSKPVLPQGIGDGAHVLPPSTTTVPRSA